jgi:hypothetical protein
MTLPTELRWEEEAHYIHTLQYFNALIRKHGAKQVLDDLKNLDLDSYAEVCYNVLQAQTKKQAAAIFRSPFNDDDGRC